MSDGFVRYKSRLVFSLMRAAARFGLRFGMPLGRMVELLQMAYFREARERGGRDLGTIAEVFGKSLRTVSSLNRRHRGDFFAPEDEVALRRQIAGRLAVRPQSEEQLVASFSDTASVELAAAVDDLLREGRILRLEDRLHRNPEDHEFLDMASMSSRIDGLNRQMDILAETVWRRLVEHDEDKRVAARSFVFAARPEDMEQVVAEVLQLVRDRAIAVDSDARLAGCNNRNAITLAAVPLEEES